MNKDQILRNVISGSMKIDVTTAVCSLVENADCKIVDGKIVEWWSKETKPTEAEIEAELKRLQDEHDAQEYARNRASEYPPIGDQLDMIYKDMKNGTTTHAEAVEAVKTKHPKG